MIETREANMPLTRRDMLHRCAASGLLVGSASLLGSVAELFGQAEKATAFAPTPVNEMGPFYRRGAPSRSMLRTPGDLGLPLTVRGTVYDTRGEARPDATVEIWQTNHQGVYDLEGYRYRALLQADPKGGYQIQTVMPGHYPDRVAQHIHYLVKAPGCRPLVTQLYFATDPAFEGDPDHNFQNDPIVLSRELIRPVLLAGDPGTPEAQVTFELHLERT
jgi:protocatechuate 3,4-dioxygenase beta subunit